MIIAIDPGHGGIDSGASNGSYREKDFTLKISLYQARRFKELGVQVVLTRDKDTYLTPGQRASIVNRSKAVICLSNHINAAHNPQANGVEVIHSIQDSTGLANRVIEVIAKEGLKARSPLSKVLTNKKGQPVIKNGNKQDYYYVPRLYNPQALIIEYGFISNSSDLGKLINDWQLYAEAVVRMICSYLGVAYVKGEKKTMTKEDANKIIQLFLSPAWFATKSKEEKAEFSRLANELRKVSGQEVK